MRLLVFQSQFPKPALGFLIAGQGTGERQGWLARGEFGFRMSDISLNEALLGTKLARSRICDPLEARVVAEPKPPCHWRQHEKKTLYYLLFTFCAAFLHVNASHCMFLGFKTWHHIRNHLQSPQIMHKRWLFLLIHLCLCKWLEKRFSAYFSSLRDSYQAYYWKIRKWKATSETRN